MKLFAPGRICLFGEHSDWAAGYRRINGELECGHTIITGTNQGAYAEVKAHPNKLILRSRLGDGTRGEFQLTSRLDHVRQEDGFVGYVVRGRRYDIGNPEAYRQTLTDFKNA
ncbi:MAG: hypothetical protein R6X19_11415 [Kiritimatiellia bacterium]